MDQIESMKNGLDERQLKMLKAEVSWVKILWVKNYVGPKEETEY
jgi:hypothetical protein